MSLKKIAVFPFFLPLLKSEAVLSYYIGKRSSLNGLHIIHNETCELLPVKEGRVELGAFDQTKTVISKGKELYEEVKLCPYCCNFE